jgi:hypothetical protein
MSLVFQIAGMTVLASISGSISPSKTMFCSQDSLRFRRRFGRCKCAFPAECRLVCMRPCDAETVVTYRAQSHSAITIIGFCPTPSSVFDTRLHSVTGSGHIRRPAALGLLLRFALTGFGSTQNKFAPKPAQNTERISFDSLRKSRPSALGSRSHSRGLRHV